MSVSVDLREGDCLRVLSEMEDESVDSIVTDPPYDLDSGKGRGFMGKEWDGTGIAFGTEVWEQCLRVLKPGGHLLAFGGTRTYHRMVCAIEDAGFQVRDCIHWTHATGFPKSIDISKQIDKAAGLKREPGVWSGRTGGGRTRMSGTPEDGRSRDTLPGDYFLTDPASEDARRWQGWGTGLKPSHEIIALCRKPISEKNIAANVLKHGTGAINIDACRVPSETETGWKGGAAGGGTWNETNSGLCKDGEARPIQGRWPANTIFSHGDCKEGCEPSCPIALLDRQSGIKTSPQPRVMRRGAKSGTSIGGHGRYGTAEPHESVVGYGDEGGASRFFHQVDPDPFVYCAKPSQRERNQGCDDLPERANRIHAPRESEEAKFSTKNANHHPTVKPVHLMRYLCRLITPPGGTVLDPFLGSGTTGVAALLEGFSFVGIEQDPDYIQIAQARIEDAFRAQNTPPLAKAG